MELLQRGGELLENINLICDPSKLEPGGRLIAPARETSCGRWEGAREPFENPTATCQREQSRAAWPPSGPGREAHLAGRIQSSTSDALGR